MKKCLSICLTAILLTTFCLAAQASETPFEHNPPALRYRTPLENGYAGITEENTLKIIGFEDETLFSVPLKAFLDADADVLSPGMPACCGDGTGGLFALFAKDEQTPQPKLHLFHLSKEGTVLWSALFEQPANWGWMHLAPDGQGGVYLIHSSWNNYKETLLRHFSSEGNILWKKLLRTEGLIFEPFVARPAEDGGFMLYATALSKSKGVYTALELQISPEGVLVQSSARDFSFRPDYSASLMWEPLSDEILFTSRANYLDTLGTEKISVPISGLEPCSLPDISIIDADFTVH